MIILVISHNIFLSIKERYQLVYGRAIDAIGVSLPVWLTEQSTSEPAEEVFCRYHLEANPSLAEVGTIPGGYRIDLPNYHEIARPDVSLEEWRKMSKATQDEWYHKFRRPPTVNNLKKISDGGSGGFLRFEVKDEMVYRNEKITVVHNVEIKTNEMLEESLL